MSQHGTDVRIQGGRRRAPPLRMRLHTIRIYFKQLILVMMCSTPAHRAHRCVRCFLEDWCSGGGGNGNAMSLLKIHSVCVCVCARPPSLFEYMGTNTRAQSTFFIVDTEHRQRLRALALSACFAGSQADRVMLHARHAREYMECVRLVARRGI